MQVTVPLGPADVDDDADRLEDVVGRLDSAGEPSRTWMYVDGTMPVPASPETFVHP